MLKTQDNVVNIMLVFLALVLSLHSIFVLTFITLELKEINQISTLLAQTEIQQTAEVQKSIVPLATPAPDSDFILGEETPDEPDSIVIEVSGENLYLPILMYHHIGYSDVNPSFYVDPVMFESQMKYLAEKKYNPITFHELLNKLNGDGELPENPLIISFDDGWKSQYKFAFPILKKYNFRAVFFPVVNYIGAESYMTWSELKELTSNGMEIGSHTINHPNLLNLSDSYLKYEIETSKLILEKNLKQKVEILSYPYCNYNSKVIRIVKELDYTSA
ncbi:polysaccharide deacetylase family protein, partial [Patescibacteria group bacterium]|nr:polysaccharide deacetylase family protein [Patescibacteria group bacterium]